MWIFPLRLLLLCALFMYNVLASPTTFQPSAAPAGVPTTARPTVRFFTLAPTFPPTFAPTPTKSPTAEPTPATPAPTRSPTIPITRFPTTSAPTAFNELDQANSLFNVTPANTRIGIFILGGGLALSGFVLVWIGFAVSVHMLESDERPIIEWSPFLSRDNCRFDELSLQTPSHREGASRNPSRTPSRTHRSRSSRAATEMSDLSVTGTPRRHFRRNMEKEESCASEMDANLVFEPIDDQGDAYYTPTSAMHQYQPHADGGGGEDLVFLPADNYAVEQPAPLSPAPVVEPDHAFNAAHSGGIRDDHSFPPSPMSVMSMYSDAQATPAAQLHGRDNGFFGASDADLLRAGYYEPQSQLPSGMATPRSAADYLPTGGDGDDGTSDASSWRSAGFHA